MMREHMIALLLAFALLTACAAAEGNLLMKTEGNLCDALLYDGETLYAVAGQFYTWRANDTQVTAWRDEIELPGPEDGQADGLFSLRGAFDGVRFFLSDGKLCGARLLKNEDDEVEALRLCDITLTGDGAVRAENTRSLSVPKKVREEGLYGIGDLCVWNGALYMIATGDRGEYVCVVEDGHSEATRTEPLSDWGGGRLYPTASGVLLTEVSYDGQPRTSLYRLSPEAGKAPVCEFFDTRVRLAASAGADAVFIVMDGRVRPIDLDTGALGEPVSSLPLPADRCALADGGRRLIAFVKGHLAVLDTTGALPEAAILTVRGVMNAPWFNEAMLEFSVTHPQANPVLEYEPVGSEVLDGMLTRSADPDVMLLPCDDDVYGPLLRRGYLLPLDDSATLKDLASRFYPGIQAKITEQGRLCALPLAVDGEGIGVGEAALNKLGFQLSDVPDTWQGFLDFIENDIRPRLGRLEEHDRFTYDEMERHTFRSLLRNEILNDWVQCADAAGVVPDYGDPRLLRLLERVDAMDLSAYGLEEDREREDWDFFDGCSYSCDGDTDYVIHWSAEYGFSEYTDDNPGTPLILGFGEDLPGVLPLRLTVACVNPYTEHADSALALLEALSEHVPQNCLYALCPDLTEPVRQPDADSVIAQYDEEIARLQAELDAAQPKDRQQAEQTLKDWQADYDRYLNGGIWLIPRDKLDWYRARGDRVTAAVSTWFQNVGQEASELMRQYDAGLIDARAFLAAVDRKARMMALEQG